MEDMRQQIIETLQGVDSLEKLKIILQFILGVKGS